MKSIQVLVVLFFTLQICSAITYNAQNAKIYLEYAKVSYCSESNIKTWNCGAPCNQLPGMKDVTVVNKLAHEGQGYAAYDSSHNNIVLAIRGSNDIINWYNNLKFEQIPFPGCQGCMVHEGFYNTYTDVKQTLVNAYKQLWSKYSSRKPTVVVTGHSLGGVVAELLSIDIFNAGARTLQLYTYGAPRLGNQVLAQYINSLIPGAARVTHYRDPVPHVPPKNILGYSYIQVPTEVFYNTQSGTSYKVCNMPGVQEDPNCSDSLLCDLIGDHLHYLGINTGCDANEAEITQDLSQFNFNYQSIVDEIINE